MGDVKIEINVEPMLKGPDPFSILCPYCLGSGRVRAMQGYMTYDAGSIRGPDTTVKCSACDGSGVKRR